MNVALKPRYSWAFPWLVGLLLFALNAWLCAPLFRLEYSARMESAEASFISISHQMISHRGDFDWWPLWYNGVPAHQTYPPLLHSVVAETAILTGWNAARAHHAVTATLYCLGPVSLFVLALRFSGSLWGSFTGALIYTLISPTVWVIPWSRNELGGLLRPWRICTLVFNGDGPHIAALAIIPLVLVALDRLLRVRGGGERWIACALGIAAVALTNWIGFFALAASSVAYLLAITTTREDLVKWAKCLWAFGLAYALACPWIPPSTVKLIPGNSALLVGDARETVATLPVRLAILLAVAAGLKILLHRMHVPWQWQFGILWLALPGALPLASEWARFDFILQPHRYQLEFDLIVCFLLTLLIAQLPRVSSRVQLAIFTTGTLLVFLQLRSDKNFMSAVIQPVAIEGTMEYRVARWLQQHSASGRVLAMGTVSYWLDAFSDVPQLGGGADQAMPNRAIGAAIQDVGTGAALGDLKGARTLQLLQAFGVDWAVVGGPHSANFFKPFQHPGIFEQIGEKVWQVGDDMIYRIPRRQQALAHVVTRENLLFSRAGLPASESELKRYVESVEREDAPKVHSEWRNRHDMEIEAAFQSENQLLSVQESYSTGWHAIVNGTRRPITKDGWGMIVIEPRCSAPCRISLIWDGGAERHYTTLASVLCLALLGAYWFWVDWSSRRGRPAF